MKLVHTDVTCGPTLGVVALCRNEVEDIGRFLGHLVDWVDEVVVVDDGSDDGTLDVLNGFGGRITVVHRRMSPDTGFAGQRNAGIKAARSDWLLHLDVDERITPALAEEIRQSISVSGLNAFRYRRLNYFLHRPMVAGGWQKWNRPQLARRGCHVFVNAIHEECVVDGGDDSVGQLNHPMHHLTDRSYVQRLEKSFVYCQAVARERIESGQRVGLLGILFRPPLVFVRKWLLQRGCIDGVPGLISAAHSACAEFRTLAIVWDEQNKIARSSIEGRLESQWSGRHRS